MFVSFPLSLLGSGVMGARQGGRRDHVLKRSTRCVLSRAQAGAGVCSVRMLSEGTGAAAEPPAGKEEHGTTSGRGAAYCNGGPAFVLPAAEAETSGGGGGGVPERVRVLCVYEGGRMPGMPVRGENP